jgi:hypothetical protein
MAKAKKKAGKTRKKSPFLSAKNGSKPANRNEKGQFGKGNKAAVGHGRHKEKKLFRELMFDCISQEKFCNAIGNMIDKAEQGNFAAVKLMLEYAKYILPPQDDESLERMAALEKRIAEMEQSKERYEEPEEPIDPYSDHEPQPTLEAIGNPLEKPGAEQGTPSDSSGVDRNG